MATNAVRRGLRAAVSSVAACRTTTAAVNVFPARSATDGFGASYHSASAWRSRAACGATTAAFGGKNASSSLLGGGAMGAALVEGVAAVGVAGQVAPGATALPFALRMLNNKAITIREELESLAEVKSHVSYSEFADIVKGAGGGDDADVAAACKTLQDAGVIIKLEDVVYLHPSQLTRDVLKVLPGVPSSVFGVSKEELEGLEAELAEMQAAMEKAAAKARFNSNAIVGSGLLLLCAQLAVFIRLTYVELSWDVMEPVSYFVGVFNAILVYIYFMLYKRDFSFDDWSTRLTSHFRQKDIENRGIDYARYKSLLKKLRK